MMTSSRGELVKRHELTNSFFIHPTQDDVWSNRLQKAEKAGESLFLWDAFHSFDLHQNQLVKYQRFISGWKLTIRKKSLSLHLLYENSRSKEKSRCGLFPSNVGVMDLSINGRNALSCWAFAIMTWTSCSCQDSPPILKRQITRAG